MQIRSISNTNFGLKIDPYMQKILDASKMQIAEKGQAELNKWEKAVNKMKSTLSDDYCIYAAKDDIYPNFYIDVYLMSDLSKNYLFEQLKQMSGKFIDTNMLKFLTEQINNIKKEHKIS